MTRVADAWGADRSKSLVRPMDDAPKNAGHVLFVLEFHRGGNSAACRISGWSGQEDDYVWSVGSTSLLHLPAMQEPQELVLETDVTVSRSNPGPSSAVIRVFVNDYLVGSACVSGWTRLRCSLSAKLIEPGRAIRLRYEHPTYVRPEFIEPDGDSRPLGVCVYGVRLFPPTLTEPMQRFAPMPAEGRVITAGRREALPARQEVPPAAVYRFAANSAGSRHLEHGWRHDPQGDAWAHERVCTIRLPAPHQPGAYAATITLTPLIIRRQLSWQRVSILLNGAVLGQFRINTETSLTLNLPTELIELGGGLTFTFILPDGLPMHPFDQSERPHFLSILLDSVAIEAVSPLFLPAVRRREDDTGDIAPIAVSAEVLDETVEALPDAIRAVTGQDVIAILKDFESLGDNCSFGLAQRKAGAEIMTLLRFANTPLSTLLAALDDEFIAATNPEEYSIRTIDDEHKEYSLYLDRYGIRWHTGVAQGEAEADKVLSDQSVRLGFLRRKFYEALRAGRKIYAVARAEPRKHPVPMPLAREPSAWEERSDRLRLPEILPLFLRLNRYGTNTLLYMTRCRDGQRPGTVELLAPGILRGYVDDFVITPDPSHHDHAAWLRIAANAWLLDRGPNASFRSKAIS